MPPKVVVVFSAPVVSVAPEASATLLPFEPVSEPMEELRVTERVPALFRFNEVLAAVTPLPPTLIPKPRPPDETLMAPDVIAVEARLKVFVPLFVKVLPLRVRLL